MHIVPVAAARFEMPQDGSGLRGIAGDLGHVVADAVFVVKFRLRKGSVLLLPPEEKPDPGIDDRLPLEHIVVIRPRHVDLREHIEVGQPADHGAGPPLRFWELFDGILRDRLAAFKGNLADGIALIRLYLEIFRGILCRARAQTIQSERIFIHRTLIVIVVFAARVQLAVDQLPVVFLFALVPIQRYAAAEILDLHGMIAVGGDDHAVAVSLARLIDGVGQDLEDGMLAALQPIGAKDDRRPFPHAVRALEGGDGLFVVHDLFGSGRFGSPCGGFPHGFCIGLCVVGLGFLGWFIGFFFHSASFMRKGSFCLRYTIMI